MLFAKLCHNLIVGLRCSTGQRLLCGSFDELLLFMCTCLESLASAHARTKPPTRGGFGVCLWNEEEVAVGIKNDVLKMSMILNFRKLGQSVEIFVKFEIHSELLGTGASSGDHGQQGGCRKLMIV